MSIAHACDSVPASPGWATELRIQSSSAKRKPSRNPIARSPRTLGAEKAIDCRGGSRTALADLQRRLETLQPFHTRCSFEAWSVREPPLRSVRPTSVRRLCDVEVQADVERWR